MATKLKISYKNGEPFGETLKFEGEKVYSQAIFEINSNLKVLKSAMSKVIADFDENNTFTFFLASKSKDLNEKIER